MANWSKNFYYTFKSINDVDEYTVEIWKDIEGDIGAPAPTLVRGDKTPCVINYTRSDVYEPVVGSGAELALFSDTDRKYFSLYTDQMMEYKVIIYKGTDLFWVGYLDSENYTENFAEIDNYRVDVTANDGFALLDRILYTDAGAGVKYEGVSSEWVVINRIIQKLNLDWENIYVGISTRSTEFTVLTGTTIFDYVYVNNENFYNEDGEPETCRTVLESILRPYGAFIIQMNGSIYITDSNWLARTHPTFATIAAFSKFVYGYETTHYDSVEFFDLVIGDVSDLGVRSNFLDFQVDAGYNKQVVAYSPYRLSKLIDYTANKDDFSVFDEYIYSGLLPYQNVKKLYTTSDIWNNFIGATFVNRYGTGEGNYQKSDYFLEITAYDPDFDATPDRKTYTLKKTLPYIIKTDEVYYLKLDMTVFPCTSDNYGYAPSEDSVPDDIKIYEVLLHMDIIVGEGASAKKYVFTQNMSSFDYTEEWIPATGTTQNVIHFRKPAGGYVYPLGVGKSLLNDADISLKKYKIIGAGETWGWLSESDFVIPLKGIDIEGGIEIIFYDYRYYKANGTDYFSTDEVYPISLQIKNVALTLVNDKFEEVNRQDVEKVAQINTNIKDAGAKILNYCGNNDADYPLERGNLMRIATGTTHTYITEFTKENATGTTENLLARSIASNYGTPNAKLTLDLPVINQVGFLTYENYLAGKKLMIMANKIDLEDNVSTMTIREIHPDSANVIIT